MKNIVALICARGGSKGIKNKNLLKIKNKTLIRLSIEQAKKIKSIKKVFVSTDSKRIAQEAIKYGAIVPFIRPKNLSRDNTPEILVWRHAVNFLSEQLKIKPNYVISLPTTSPLRKVSDIKFCIQKILKKKKIDIVFTVTKSIRNPHFNMVKVVNKKLCLYIKSKKKYFRRQDAPESFDLCTVCYIFKPDYIKKNSDLFSGVSDFVEIPRERSIDIDSKFDFKLCELLLKYDKK